MDLIKEGLEHCPYVSQYQCLLHPLFVDDGDHFTASESVHSTIIMLHLYPLYIIYRSSEEVVESLFLGTRHEEAPAGRAGLYIFCDLLEECESKYMYINHM